MNKVEMDIVLEALKDLVTKSLDALDDIGMANYEERVIDAKEKVVRIYKKGIQKVTNLYKPE